MRPAIACVLLSISLHACDPVAGLFGSSSPPAIPARPAPMAPPASPPTPPTVPQAARCEAAPRGAFHLRPTAQIEAAGPELAAGTRLEVLAREGVGRRRGELFRVRVIDSGATGYAFLTLEDLGPACPFAWDEPLPPPPRANEPATSPPILANGCLARAGWHPTRAASLVDAARDLSFTTEWRAHLAHNGMAVELAQVESAAGCPGEGVYALFLHGPRGWRTLELGADTRGEHHGRDVRRVETPGGALILIEDSEQFDDAVAPIRHTTCTLHRITAEGELAPVWSATNSGLTLEDWTFTAAGDDTIVLASPEAHRQQRLVWNTSRTALSTRR